MSQANSKIIEFRNVSKRFGAVMANEDLCFSVQAGSIHGIIGENGAGKSTAMKILFGMYQPDSGEFFLDGKSCQFKSPVDSMNAGIGMVHQHFMLAEALTALDNVILYQDFQGSSLSKINRKALLEQLEAVAKKYGFQIDWNEIVENLPVGVQQRIEIIKILSRDSRIIILDEPTAVLTPQEVLEFFEQLRRLKAEGKTILIITHKLKEILSITDAVTVFRSGRAVANQITKDCTIESLAEIMMGHSDSLSFQWHQSPKLSTRKMIHLSTYKFDLHHGEIVGIAGVEGNGQDSLIQEFLDSTKKTEFIVGQLPEDRLKFGMLKNRPAFENFYLTHRGLAEFRSGLFLNIKKLIHETFQQMKKFDVRPTNAKLDLDGFSGGNQQKFVVARELYHEPNIILAAQPTRGVDIGAIQYIHTELLKARDAGTSVLLVSSELDELMKLSDRILVLYRNQIIAEFQRNQFNEITIGAAMGGKGSLS